MRPVGRTPQGLYGRLLCCAFFVGRAGLNPTIHAEQHVLGDTGPVLVAPCDCFGAVDVFVQTGPLDMPGEMWPLRMVVILEAPGEGGLWS